MAVQESVHARQFPAGCVMIALSPLFPPVVAILPPHESVRVLAELLADLGMLLQKFLQRRMVRDPVLVVNQRRILAKLFRGLRMAVQELVHIRQFSTGRVVVLGVPDRGSLST